MKRKNPHRDRIHRTQREKRARNQRRRAHREYMLSGREMAERLAGILAAMAAGTARPVPT